MVTSPSGPAGHLSNSQSNLLQLYLSRYTDGAYLFEIRNGVSGVIDVEARDAVCAEEEGQKNEDDNENRDVGDGQTSK